MQAKLKIYVIFDGMIIIALDIWFSKKKESGCYIFFKSDLDETMCISSILCESLCTTSTNATMPWVAKNI